MSMKTVIALVFLCVSATVADPQQIPEDNGPLESKQDDPTQNQIADNHSGVPSTMSCQPDVCRLIGEMGAMATRLAASERIIQDLRGIVVQQASMVTQQQSTIEELRSVVFEQSSMLHHQSSIIEEVRNRPKVAFSVSLYASGDNVFGPFPGDFNLVFRTIFTNVGNAYSPASGIFEAPVKGVYYFRFTVFSLNKDYTRVSLFQNGQQIVTVTDNKSTDDKEDGSSNAAVLELEQGDEVHLVLRKGHAVYDDANHHTTFSGFLLFTQS